MNQNIVPLRRRVGLPVVAMAVGLGFTFSAQAVPLFDEPSWTVAPFLVSKTQPKNPNEPYGTLAVDFAPWNTVLGRDGEYYGRVNDGASPGGLVYALGNKAYYPQNNPYLGYGPGKGRKVYQFIRNAALPANRLIGSLPAESLAVGQDGGIYGRTTEGGVFAAGLLFKLDRTGRYQALHHFETAGVPGDMIVAEDGTVYAATSAGYPSQTGWVFRLGKDGGTQNLPVASGELTGLVETAAHDIVVATIPAGELPAVQKGQLWKLGATGEFSLLAEVGHSPRKLVALPNGDVLVLASDRILQVTPAGAVSVWHETGGLISMCSRIPVRSGC